MVIEIGRRYLGVEEDIKDHDDNDEKTELNNLSQNNVSPKRFQLFDKSEGQPQTENDLVIDILNDEVISLVKQKIQSEKLREKFCAFSINNKCLFIDSPKELFETSFQAVKRYLAGEPFREFEASMFFHR